jgi:glutathione synthase/RimK-type ligase-like ATP-grasp enzyme
MILIITSKRDGHVNGVATVLDKAGVPWVRMNTEDLPRNLDMALEPSTGVGTFALKDSGRSFVLSAVDTVWYRKPDAVNLSHFELDTAGREYVEAEFNEILHGLYALWHRAYWINNPLTSRLAHRKLLQLNVAQSIGFQTPRTLITNQVDKVLEFAQQCNWNLAIKSLGAISVASHHQDGMVQYGVFTRRIGKEELLALQDKIPYMPTMFQEYVPKQHELRVTVVGKQIFACRIDSQANELTREDMRFDVRSLRHSIVQCPDITNKVLAYMHAFRLNFGCFDIAVSQHDEYVFFECNPNGQYAWIEELTGAPISQAVADMLIQNHAGPIGHK